jgi:predicted TPR repeat methyltransferase
VDCDRATVKRRYDRLAKFTPLFDRLLFLPAGLRREAVASLRLRTGERVLELGCGTGIGLSSLPPIGRGSRLSARRNCHYNSLFPPRFGA